MLFPFPLQVWPSPVLPSLCSPSVQNATPMHSLDPHKSLPCSVLTSLLAAAGAPAAASMGWHKPPHQHYLLIPCHKCALWHIHHHQQQPWGCSARSRAPQDRVAHIFHTRISYTLLPTLSLSTKIVKIKGGLWLYSILLLRSKFE